MNIIAFAASSSTQSINKKLVTYASTLVPQHIVEILDLNDYEMPLFSEDRERELGQPALAHAFLAKLGGADAIILSFAEHNGSYSAAYKNLFDWCSRINTKVYQGKEMVVLSTSPGGGGGRNVLAAALDSLPHFDAVVKASLSIPKFYDHFDVENGKLTDESFNNQLTETLATLG